MSGSGMRMGGGQNETRRIMDKPKELAVRSSCAMSVHTSTGHEYDEGKIWAEVGVGLWAEAEIARVR